ncbi:MAG: hypothetical protein IT370_02830 [Deltaproteobacteria bacterium]|nr:hypothetical protein [Deltaproteobacteria bacterium]
MRTALGATLGVVAAATVLGAVRPAPGRATLLRGAHVSESPSGGLERIAIHYAPAFDAVALPVWQRLLPALPPRLAVDVVVASREDFERFAALLPGWGVASPARFRPVVTGGPVTTWARDRLAAIETPAGPRVLAPPRTAAPFAGRQGDARAPAALAHAMGSEPSVAEFVFEGGDLVSTPRWLFADINLVARNLGRVAGGRAVIEAALRAHFSQRLIWLGDEVGELPEHHIMMYMVPLGDAADTVVVGDLRAGLALRDAGRGTGVGAAAAADADAEATGPTLVDDVDTWAARFDRAAELLRAQGFKVVRMPVLVLAGGGSYVTYTNALFDRDAAGPVVYLPTYGMPALDQAAARIYRGLGLRVQPIDVSSIYQLEGSLGCLVAVLARAAR